MLQKLKLRLIIAGGILFLLFLGGIGWYLGYYTKTPDYALEQVEKALNRRDARLFHQYVDMERVAESSYEPFMDALMESEHGLSAEAKNSMGSFLQMLKSPLKTSFLAAVDDYVSTGSWDDKEATETSQGPEDSSQVVARAGLKTCEWRQIDAVTEDDDGRRAVASLRIYQQEAQGEFVLEILLEPEEDGHWQVVGINNIRDYIAFLAKARLSKLSLYVTESAAIMDKHDQAMREAQLRLTGLMAAGSLGSQDTREALKGLMEDIVLTDWQNRRDELSALTVPDAALTLHRLRLRICDLHIAYATGYAAWMTDKQAATIRAADVSLKQARTLEQEARFLTNRISGETKRDI